MSKHMAAKMARKVEWNTAIAEGRVVRSQGGLSFASFPTQADARAAVARIQAAGMEADIVPPGLANRNPAIQGACR